MPSAAPGRRVPCPARPRHGTTIGASCRVIVFRTDPRTTRRVRRRYTRRSRIVLLTEGYARGVRHCRQSAPYAHTCNVGVQNDTQTLRWTTSGAGDAGRDRWETDDFVSAGRPGAAHSYGTRLAERRWRRNARILLLLLLYTRSDLGNTTEHLKKEILVAEFRTDCRARTYLEREIERENTQPSSPVSRGDFRRVLSCYHVSDGSERLA